MLDPKPGEAVLDFCAAPGGKLTAIAARMEGTGTLVAHDVSSAKIELIASNCSRMGVTNVELACSTNGQAFPGAAPLAPERLFDRVLIDAPCSNTGVMRRRVELRWRIEPTEIERICDVQRELLNTGAGRVRAGGLLIYSTCSLEPEENERQIQRFLAQNPSFQLQHEHELTPFVDETDGAYVAQLVRK
jgi:16S rRNA (cytosine967-C5)-methyltransferase